MAVDRLSLTFGALADPTRRAIVARLARGGASVTEIAEPFDMSLPAVSKHLKVLERAGLVTRGKEAQWRPAALEAGPLKEIDERVVRGRVILEQRLAWLGQDLQKTQMEEKRDRPQGKRRGKFDPRERHLNGHSLAPP